MIHVDTAQKSLSFAGESFPCILGRGGVRPEAGKREGDGATPLGRFRLVGALLRPDRMPAPETALPWRWLRRWDGWSDDCADPQYNDAVALPHGFGAEELWRADCCYDVIVVLDHNRRPVRKGSGSAVFWHLMRPGQRQTQGCVAVAPEVLLSLLPRLHAGMAFCIGTS